MAWSWRKAEQQAFNTLKLAVICKLVLLFPDDNQPFCIEADSSDFTTNAVLSQQSWDDGKWHPVAFYSKSLNAMEQNYEIHNKEMLAIIQSLEEWHHFLEGAQHKFKVWMDHKNLEYFRMAKKLNCHQAWWSLYLTNFDFLLHHKPGRSMKKPNMLLQHANHSSRARDNDNITLLRLELFIMQALEEITAQEDEVDILWDICQENQEGMQEDSVAKAMLALCFSHPAGTRSIHTSKWGLQDGLLTFCSCIYIPNDLEL